MAGRRSIGARPRGAARAGRGSRIPVYLNAMGRGSLNQDHATSSRGRRVALTKADCILVIGTPMDFRLAYGGVFGAKTTVHRRRSRLRPDRPHPREVAAGLYGDLTTILTALAGATSDRQTRHGSVSAGGRRSAARRLRSRRTCRRPHTDAPDAGVRRGDRAAGPRRHRGRRRRRLRPLRRARHRQLRAWGVAGQRTVRLPGAPGPGYALAAKLARPDRQVVLLQGDGASGSPGMEWDTLVRHGVHVVLVIGNNGIGGARVSTRWRCCTAIRWWPSCCAGTRYDEAVTALGGHGELVSTPSWGTAARLGKGVLGAGLPAVAERADRPGGGVPPQVKPGLTPPRPTVFVHRHAGVILCNCWSLAGVERDENH